MCVGSIEKKEYAVVVSGHGHVESDTQHEVNIWLAGNGARSAPYHIPRAVLGMMLRRVKPPVMEIPPRS